MRELLWVTDFEGKKWAEQLKKLLLKSKKLKENSIKNNILFLDKEILGNIKKEYLKILENGEKEYGKYTKIKCPLKELPLGGKKGRTKKEKGYNLLLRLRKGIDGTLGFIYDFNLPFTNNLAERDLRMFKLKNKISGCFTLKGHLVEVQNDQNILLEFVHIFQL